MTSALKLYVWPAVFEDYTAGCAFAIAASKRAAAMLALDGHEFYGVGGSWRGPDGDRDYVKVVLERKLQELLDAECEEHALDVPYGFSISGGG